MPAPETDWVDGIIPPAPFWRVRRRYLGLFTSHIYDDPDACFAANATCRRIYSRYPTDRDGNYQPLAYPRSLCPDCLPDDPVGDGSDADPGAHADAGATRGDDAIRSGDGDRSRHADHLRADNGDPGHAGDLLLDGGPADPITDAHPSPVRDADSADAVPEGGVDGGKSVRGLSGGPHQRLRLRDRDGIQPVSAAKEEGELT